MQSLGETLTPSPRIEVDYSRCTTPMACKKCLQVCPQAVFWVWPVKVEKFKETDPQEPGSFRILPMYKAKCTVCNDCVEVCPVDALTVTL